MKPRSLPAPSGVGSHGPLTRAALLRTMPWDGPDAPDWAPLVEREWLVANGLGGYSSGTVSGAATRRYHGLLISAEPPPLGRVLTLADLVETLHLPDGRRLRIGGEETPEELHLHGSQHLSEFLLEWGLPVWTYRVEGRVLQKRLTVPYERNTAVVEYRLLEGDALGIEIRPTVRLRQHDTPVDAPLEEGYRAEATEDGVRVTGVRGAPDLWLLLSGDDAELVGDARVMAEFLYRVEVSRGYGSVGDTWSPGSWTAVLRPGTPVALVASTDARDEVPSPRDAEQVREREIERRHRLVERAHPAARSGPAAELVLAADQFIVQPLRRWRTRGEAERSVIAGYHWFTDWGRDTMISLEGLTLVTGRAAEGGTILRTFGSHVKDGLIPNLFPEGGDEGLYHTADATLWFFHALDRYLEHTGDQDTLLELLPRVREIVERHLEGTHFGIGVDPADGLLRQGAEGYQLTWMDAKVDDWVVTPRRGKAVEINALWYNALRVASRWEAEVGEEGRALALDEHAERARASFNRRFWIEGEGHLHDVVDGEHGDDPTFRPNQIFAVSLPHPVLARERWASVVDAVSDRLLTPVGLRSLAPGHPDYRETYLGTLWERDAAYHQGTVWAWLIGPFVDAWLRVHPGEEGRARALLDGLIAHLDEFGIGSVAEIFDAEEPYRPRGCIAQAWSVAELLRCLVATSGTAG